MPRKLKRQTGVMERMAALRCIVDSGRVSKQTEYFGFLTMQHPEIPLARRLKLAASMAQGRENT